MKDIHLDLFPSPTVLREIDIQCLTLRNIRKYELKTLED